MTIEIGTRLLVAIIVVVLGAVTDRWWHYASRRPPGR